MIGETPTTALAATAALMPGTARMVPMLTTGLDGGNSTTSAASMASSTPGAGRARSAPDATICASYVQTHAQLIKAGYKVIEVPMERECRTVVADARRGKNMFALGMLCNLYSLELQLAREQIALTFGKKAAGVIKTNVMLLEAEYQWAEANLDFAFRIPAVRASEPQIVVNGSGLGIAAGQ